MPEEAIEAGCTDVASQLVDFPFGDGLELALGGGRRHFLPAEKADPEDEGETGRRTDGRDLTAEWVDAGGSVVYDLAGFEALDPTDGAPVLGLFERSHLEYEADRPNDSGGEPSLADMTAFAIEKLMAESGDAGFVLNVESGRVDHAAHAGNAYRMLTDNVEFAEAVQTALDMVDLDETLIIVTADHAHTVTLAGYAQRGNDILGLVRGLDGQGEPVDEPVLAADGKPYTSIGFANGPGAADIIGQPERPTLTEEMVLDPDFRQQALVPMSSETHGGTDIITYAHGPHAFLVRGVVEQNYVFHVMEKALDLRSRASQASLLRPGFEQRALEILDAALPEVGGANAEAE
jgi:alkaline phosphatase